MATFDILLPVRNGVAYLALALDSVVAQSYKDWRLIVLDHGSEDGSFELAAAYAERDPRIVIRSYPQAQGLSELLNHGLDCCDARYVARQDADDISSPDRLQVTAAAFEADTELVLIGSSVEIINSDGKRIGMTEAPLSSDAVRARALFQTPMSHPTIAMKLDRVTKLGARYGHDFIRAVPEGRRLAVSGLAEDYFLFAQLAQVAKCMNIDRHLVQFRQHATNVSKTKHAAQLSTALVISRYLAETLSIMHGVSRFDPGPFCTHGETLGAFGERVDFSDEYRAVEFALHAVLGQSRALARELAFRKALRHRARLLIARRYAMFSVQHGVRTSEWRTVRAWMTRGLRRQESPPDASSSPDKL